MLHSRAADMIESSGRDITSTAQGTFSWISANSGESHGGGVGVGLEDENLTVFDSRHWAPPRCIFPRQEVRVGLPRIIWEGPQIAITLKVIRGMSVYSPYFHGGTYIDA